jgi:hypothetical protein
VNRRLTNKEVRTAKGREFRLKSSFLMCDMVSQGQWRVAAALLR